ncbi:M4 family metallopeptidase [Streptomyces sp. NPDC057325]|uniref:M4 family metallopeptidase n=1 Tax=unclassified Streptomyces TaxID=2593676 RepID=UPI00364299F3
MERPGIGKDKAAAVWYRALSTYMTSTTNYAGARTATLQAARDGSWYAWMMGYGADAVESLSQSNIAVPSTGTPKLTFWLKVSTQESGSTAYDTLKVNVNGTTLATYSNAHAGSGYVQRTVDLSAHKGQTVKLEFAGTEDTYLPTIFLLDQIAIG